MKPCLAHLVHPDAVADGTPAEALAETLRIPGDPTCVHFLRDLAAGELCACGPAELLACAPSARASSLLHDPLRALIAEGPRHAREDGA